MPRNPLDWESLATRLQSNALILIMSTLVRANLSITVAAVSWSARADLNFDDSWLRRGDCSRSPGHA